ncbi:hypothetical protein LTS08_008482 [Lithohypha guttulata]|nr:hypothetical protein LTS08_008482 [Lithohypha guttulata]
MLEPGLLKAIKNFTTCDLTSGTKIGDALVKLRVAHGGYLSGLKMYSPQYCSGSAKLCGPAHTVRMVHASDKTSPTLQQHFADSITPGSVVFVSQPEGLISACWGGLMSTRASKIGAAGVVIDGRFRDINEHRDINISLFARGSSILGSNSFTRASEINVPVQYRIEEVEDAGDVVIRPGDIIMGDADGVVAIPVEVVRDCVKLCQERADIDEKTMEALRNGEEMGPTLKRLRK